MNREKFPSKKSFKNICEEFQLCFLVLFGSSISKTTHGESDLDIAVYPENGFEALAAKLEQKLGQMFHNPRIDLTNLKTAGPLLQKEVALTGEVLYARDTESFPLFQMYAVRAYYDFLPYLRLREQVISERIKNLSL